MNGEEFHAGSEGGQPQPLSAPDGASSPVEPEGRHVSHASLPLNAPLRSSFCSAYAFVATAKPSLRRSQRLAACLSVNISIPQR